MHGMHGLHGMLIIGQDAHNVVGAPVQVAAGAALVVLEAMKMEHTVCAPHAGVVAGLSVVTGAQVAQGQLLARVMPEAAAP